MTRGGAFSARSQLFYVSYRSPARSAAENEPAVASIVATAAENLYGFALPKDR